MDQLHYQHPFALDDGQYPAKNFMLGSDTGTTGLSNLHVGSGGSSVGATVSVNASGRMKTYVTGNINVAQQTRHARRIYVGGIPPNFIDEDGLRNFLNSVIAQGLNEENDESYVLSVYINQKKCFAFVELKAIELAAACLELDGIMMKNIALRILRANEYKPELVPASVNKNLRFDLSSFQFGVPSTSISGSNQDMDEITMDRTFESIIQPSSVTDVEPGSIVIVGYPYDENPKKATIRGMGCSNAPKILRNSIRKFKFGSLENPEFGEDLSQLKIMDVGDILGGKVLEEARSNLTCTIVELLARGSIPFVVGGTNDMVYSSLNGLMSIASGNIASVHVSSQADLRLFDDSRFCSSKSPHALGIPNCYGRFILFGAQVNPSLYLSYWPSNSLIDLT